MESIRTLKTKTPAEVVALAGAMGHSARGAQAEQYPTADAGATFDLDSDKTQAVTAYVSHSTIYVIDENLTVLAYGTLTGCGVRS